jgi:DNA-binding IclR family transcriptional regulator
MELWEEADSSTGLLDALATIKKEAFAMTHLKNRHVKGFAVPIFVNEKVVAGLSVFVPEYRCIGTHENDIIEGIKKMAQIISQRLVK